jgi:hypothetical protein
MTIPPLQHDTAIIPPNLVESLQAAQHVAVLTGAGISAEPAMPTNLSRHSYAYANKRSTTSPIHQTSLCNSTFVTSMKPHLSSHVTDSEKECTYSVSMIKRYKKRISGSTHCWPVSRPKKHGAFIANASGIAPRKSTQIWGRQ